MQSQARHLWLRLCNRACWDNCGRDPNLRLGMSQSLSSRARFDCPKRLKKSRLVIQRAVYCPMSTRPVPQHDVDRDESGHLASESGLQRPRCNDRQVPKAAHRSCRETYSVNPPRQPGIRIHHLYKLSPPLKKMRQDSPHDSLSRCSPPSLSTTIRGLCIANRDEMSLISPICQSVRIGNPLDPYNLPRGSPLDPYGASRHV